MKSATEGESKQPNRTIYLGGLPLQTTIADLCDLITDGPLEQVKLLPQKNCAFLSFFDDKTGIAAHERLRVSGTQTLYGKPIVVGWGAVRPLPEHLMSVIATGASRNLFIGGHVERATEAYLREVLSRFGPLDCFDFLPAKKMAFVHFASLKAAVQCKETLGSDPQWAPFRLNYGKDRCSPEGTGQPHGASKSRRGLKRPADFLPLGLASAPLGPGYGQPEQSQRTVYLGGVPEDLVSEAMDQVQAGVVEQIRVLPEKKCCFITFMDPTSAALFMAKSSQGLVVRGQLFKVGWAKVDPVSTPRVLEGFRKGATRNLVLGNLHPSVTAQELSTDLGQYGHIEKVDLTPDRRQAFVHFMSIAAAMGCVEALSTSGSPLYERYKDKKVYFANERSAGLHEMHPRGSAEGIPRGRIFHKPLRTVEAPIATIPTFRLPGFVEEAPRHIPNYY